MNGLQANAALNRQLVRAGTWLCPSGETSRRLHHTEAALHLSAIGHFDDAWRHLRLHGVEALVGLVVLAFGDGMFAFTSNGSLADVATAATALGIFWVVKTVTPHYSALEGCDLALSARPPAPHPHRHRLVPALLGLFLLGSASTYKDTTPLFDLPNLAAVVISGVSLLLLSYGITRRSRSGIAAGLRMLAAGTTCACVAATLWAVLGATENYERVAAVISAVGALSYSVSFPRLTTLYNPPSLAGRTVT